MRAAQEVARFSVLAGANRNFTRHAARTPPHVSGRRCPPSAVSSTAASAHWKKPQAASRPFEHAKNHLPALLPFFVTRIELDETRSEIAKRFQLHPGQRTEILVMTGQRTLLDHILDPVMRNINRAFRA